MQHDNFQSEITKTCVLDQTHKLEEEAIDAVTIPDEDDSNTVHINLMNDVTWSINLHALKQEIGFSNIISSLKTKTSFKSIAVLICATLLTLGPPGWDMGSDLNLGLTYLNGDIYIRKVTDPNASSVSNYNCTLIEVTQIVTEGNKSDVGAKYTFSCEERDPCWGWLTLVFVFVLPGFALWLHMLLSNQSFFKKLSHQRKTVGYGIQILCFFLIPFFPLQVFLAKLLAVLTGGPELEKVSKIMTYQEIIEAIPQFFLQIYILLSRADTVPSTSQIVTLSSSILSILRGTLNGYQEESILKKIKIIPCIFCGLLYIAVGGAICEAILGPEINFLVWIFPLVIWTFLLCFKKKISDRIIKMIANIISCLQLFSIIALIKWFPDVIIPGITYSNTLKLSDIAIVKYGLFDWIPAKCIIYTVLVCGVTANILLYFQKIKPKKIVKVSDKDDPDNVYEITIGAMKESPLENEVRDVLVNGETYVVPMEDFKIEKYPLRSNVKYIVKHSKFNTITKKKVFVVEKKNLIELNDEASPSKDKINKDEINALE